MGFEGVKLKGADERKTLAQYGIRDMSDIDLEILADDMQIYVTNSNGEKITLPVKRGDTVWKLKQNLVGKKFGTADQVLGFRGQQLEDQRTLAEYNIEKWDNLLFLADCGGGATRRRLARAEDE